MGGFCLSNTFAKYHLRQAETEDKKWSWTFRLCTPEKYPLKQNYLYNIIFVMETQIRIQKTN